MLTLVCMAAHLSGGKLEAMEELDAASSKEDGFISSSLKQIKRWLVSHSQHLNFFTILVLASVSFHIPFFFSRFSSVLYLLYLLEEHAM